ncbi:MAG: AI-2E family transporter [Clostridia bacterium]|nr:AI-2E family transporter [Clostridium sp.]
MNNTKKDWSKWIYWFLLGIALILVYKGLDNYDSVMNGIKGLMNVLSPFIVGIFIAYLLYMPARKFEEWFNKVKIKFIRKRSRALSVITVYLIILAIIIVLFSCIMPIVFGSIADFLNNLQGYITSAVENYNKLPEDSFFKGQIVQDVMHSLQNINIKQYFNVEQIIGYVTNAISAVFSVIDIFIAIIVSIYILTERKQIIAFLKKLTGAIFKENTYKNIDKYFNNSNEIFFKFIASQFLDAVVVGILVTIALTIMKVKYAPLLGFFIGMFNMIPYVGAIIATVIAVLVTLITGGLSQAIWMIIVVVILQQIDANIINPKIVGQSLKISPLLVLFAVTVGGAYFGILGMFLAVPVIAILKILINDYIEYKNKLKEQKNNMQ